MVVPSEETHMPWFWRSEISPAAGAEMGAAKAKVAKERTTATTEVNFIFADWEKVVGYQNFRAFGFVEGGERV